MNTTTTKPMPPIFRVGTKVRLSEAGLAAHVTDMEKWTGTIVATSITHTVPNHRPYVLSPEWVRVEWVSKNVDRIVCSRCMDKLQTIYIEHKSFLEENKNGKK